MRKTITKGSYVKITSTEFYRDSNDLAIKLGADEKKLGGTDPAKDNEGEVMGMEDGYVLIDFGDVHRLIDIEDVKLTPKPKDIKIIVRYLKNNSIEEFLSEDDLKKRISNLISTGSVGLKDELKVYEVSNVKSLKIKLDVFLD